MFVNEWVSERLSDWGIVCTDLTYVTLVSEDTLGDEEEDDEDEEDEENGEDEEDEKMM